MQVFAINLQFVCVILSKSSHTSLKTDSVDLQMIVFSLHCIHLYLCQKASKKGKGKCKEHIQKEMQKGEEMKQIEKKWRGESAE